MLRWIAGQIAEEIALTTTRAAYGTWSEICYWKNRTSDWMFNPSKEKIASQQEAHRRTLQTYREKHEIRKRHHSTEQLRDDIHTVLLLKNFKLEISKKISDIDSKIKKLSNAVLPYLNNEKIRNKKTDKEILQCLLRAHSLAHLISLTEEQTTKLPNNSEIVDIMVTILDLNNLPSQNDVTPPSNTTPRHSQNF